MPKSRHWICSQIHFHPETCSASWGHQWRLPLRKKNKMLISVCTPTMTNSQEIKDKFYEELDVKVAVESQSEKFFVLGDFNTQVGTDYQTWKESSRRHGTGKCNSYDLLLFKTYSGHDLVGSSIFSAFLLTIKQFECTYTLGICIWLTISSLGRGTGRMWVWQGSWWDRWWDWLQSHCIQEQTSHCVLKTMSRLEDC